MSLGYEVYEDDRSFEAEGITGNVRRYSTDKMVFPCYIMKSHEANLVPLYKIQTLQNMFKTGTKQFNEEDGNSTITIYFEQDGTTLRLGHILPIQVKPFLTLMEGNDVVGFLDKDTFLEDDYLYVLAG